MEYLSSLGNHSVLSIPLISSVPLILGGEFTASVGGVYDISNLDRLGTSEVVQVQCVIDGVQELIKLEKMMEEGKDIKDALPELPAEHQAKE